MRGGIRDRFGIIYILNPFDCDVCIRCISCEFVMTDIPNCSNCSNETCPNNHMHDNAYKDWGAEQSRKEIQSHTLKRGCLKNPQAQGYLMKDVIEELEKTIKCNSRWEKLEPYYQGVNEMCKRAIDLIRNGVK